MAGPFLGSIYDNHVEMEDVVYLARAEDSNCSPSSSSASSYSSSSLTSISSLSSLLSTPNRSSYSLVNSFDCDNRTWELCVELSHESDDSTLAPWNGYYDLVTSSGYGDLAEGTFPEGNLSNSIHPLLDPHRFIPSYHDIAFRDQLLEGILPALQLTSRMLTSAPVMAFWRRLKYGKEIPYCNSPCKIIAPCPSEDGPAADALVRDDLIALSDKVKLVFGVPKPDKWDSNQTHALHCDSLKDVGQNAFVRADLSGLPATGGKYHYIVINETYGHYFKHSQHRTLDRDMKTQFSLATTLIHEIGHAYYARNQTDGEFNYNEPWYDHRFVESDEEAEIGNQLDYVLYGARVHEVVDPNLGAFSEHSPLLFAYLEDKSRQAHSHVVFPTCPRWIISWFQEDKWIQLERKWSRARNSSIRQSQDFNVPRVDWGATREKSCQDNSWRWTPRRKIMNGLDAIHLMQNHFEKRNSTHVCIEEYEAKDKAAVKRLQRTLAELKEE